MRLFPLKVVFGVLIFSSVFCFGLPKGSFEAYAQNQTGTLTLRERLPGDYGEKLDEIERRINEITDLQKKEDLLEELRKAERSIENYIEATRRLMSERSLPNAGELIRRKFLEELDRLNQMIPREAQPLQTSDGRDCARSIEIVLDSMTKKVTVTMSITDHRAMLSPEVVVIGSQGVVTRARVIVEGDQARVSFDAPPGEGEWRIILTPTASKEEAALLGTIEDGKISPAANPVLSEELATGLNTELIGVNERLGDSLEVQVSQANDDFAVASSPEGLSPVNRLHIDFGEERAPTGKRETLQELIIRFSRRGPAGYPGGVEYFATDHGDVEISPVHDSSAGALSVRGKSLLVGDRPSSLKTPFKKERQKPLVCPAGTVYAECLEEEERRRGIGQ